MSFLIPLPHSLQVYGIRNFNFVPTFYTFFAPCTEHKSESLENRRDVVVRPISSPDDIRTACWGAIRNIKKDGGLPTVNSD